MDLSIKALKSKGNKTVVQCHSTEEWDEILLLCENTSFNSFKNVVELNNRDYISPCFFPCGKQYCSEKYYIKEGYTIVQAKDVIAYNRNEPAYQIY